MKNEPMLYGVGGAFVGLLVGMITGGPGGDEIEAKLMAAMESQSAATLAAVEQQMGDLDTRLDTRLGGLDQRLDEVAVGLSAVTSGLGDMDGAFAAIADSQGAMGETVKAHLDDVMAGLMGKIDGMATSGAAADRAEAPAAEAPAATETAATETAAAPAEPETPPEGTPVGKTEVMLDGKARVFVSKINEEEGIVRVAINGLNMQMIGGWRKATFEVDGQPCSLSLDAIDRGHAQMSASCG